MLSILCMMFVDLIFFSYTSFYRDIIFSDNSHHYLIQVVLHDSRAIIAILLFRELGFTHLDFHILQF
jgi:hypothetical protein